MDPMDYGYSILNMIRNDVPIVQKSASTTEMVTDAISSGFGASYDSIASAINYVGSFIAPGSNFGDYYKMMMNYLPSGSAMYIGIAILSLMFLIGAVIAVKIMMKVVRYIKSRRLTMAAAAAAAKPSPLNKMAMSKMVGAAASLPPATKMAIMKRIYAALKIYMYAWFKDVYRRSVDLIKLMLKPLITAWYVARALASFNLTRAERSLQLDAFGCASAAALNRSIDSGHACAVREYGNVIVRCSFFSESDRANFMKVLEQIRIVHKLQ